MHLKIESAKFAEVNYRIREPNFSHVLLRCLKQLNGYVYINSDTSEREIKTILETMK